MGEKGRAEGGREKGWRRRGTVKGVGKGKGEVG